MRYHFTYEPPQPNSPLEIVIHQALPIKRTSNGTLYSIPLKMGSERLLSSRAVNGFLHRIHAPSKTSPSYPFRGGKEPMRPSGAWRFTALTLETGMQGELAPHLLFSALRKTMSKVEVFQWRPKTPSYATPPESFLVSN